MCILESERLILRRLRPSDVTALAVWLGDYDVAKMTARIPWPYDEDDALDFIACGARADGELVLVLERRLDGVFLGEITLHANGEFGYWLGKPFWGQGYATEAAYRLATHAFTALGWEALTAGWFCDNPASGRVLAKLGARHNGSAMRFSQARGRSVLCHEMLLTRADFLRKQAA